jgi:CubicO group peptidase (beta-lactamase class C family)
MRHAIQPEFDRNFVERGELGAAFAVYSAESDTPLVELHGGFCDRAKSRPWTAGTMVLLWSATKGLGAACVLAALERRGLTPDVPLAEIWAAFAAHGREKLTITQVLTHQAGVPALDEPAPSILDHEAVIAALERQNPLWTPGEAHGYHVRIFGFLCDELVRRLAGVTLAQAWREWFAIPLDLRIWIGLPAELHGDVADVVPPRGLDPDPAEAAFYHAFNDPDSLTRRAFSSPAGLNNISAMNGADVRSAAIPSLGAIGDALSLSKFYAALANGGAIGGTRVLAEATLDWVAHAGVSGPDQVLAIETAFSMGFMRDPIGSDGAKTRLKMGPCIGAFGHPGAGGVNAFADPVRRIGFAYVMNQMRSGVLPNAKSLALIDAAYGAMMGDS